MTTAQQDAQRLNALADAAADKAADLTVLWQCGALPDDSAIKQHEALCRTLRELSRLQLTINSGSITK